MSTRFRAKSTQPHCNLHGAGVPPDGLPAHLAERKGQVGQVSVAVAANGVMHFWDHAAAWYLEWEELAEGTSPRRGFGMDEADEAGRPSEEERARLVGELGL